jgi:OmcA/MtrC family decaheme c-type cytochrome
MSDPADQALIYAIGDPLVVEITDVTVSSPPVIAYKVTTQNGAAVSGVGTVGGNDRTQGSVRGVFDKLIETDGAIRSHWVSYINSSSLPPLHATRETGTVVEDADTPGTYTFTYTTDVTDVDTPVTVSYEPTLTHRASMEIRFSDNSLNPDNPWYDFVPDGGDLPETKDIANTNLCNNCHQRLAEHGNGRFTVENCVTCHNSSTGADDVPVVGAVDGALTNVDLAHLVHGIHSTALDAFDEVTYPRFLVDCATCHTASEETPDGDDWKESVDSLSCGGCHMNRLEVLTVDQGTGLATYGFRHDFETIPDGDCLNCHNGGIAAAGFTADNHQNLTAAATAKFQYNILGVTATDEGEFPTITFSVTDPTNGDAKYDLAQTCAGPPVVTQCPWDPVWGGATRLAVTIAWPTDAYSNINSGSEETNPLPPGSPENRPGSPAQPVSIDVLSNLPAANLACQGGTAAGESCEIDGDCPGGTCVEDGTYTVTSPVAVPAGLTGDSIAVTIEGHPLYDLNENGVADEEPPWRNEEIPVTGAVAFLEIGVDPTDDPTPRYQVVDIDKCNSCHGKLSLHGNNRTDNIDLCVTCHNGNATDIRARQEAIEGTFGNELVPGDKSEEAIDFKRMIHQIHDANVVIYGFGGSRHDYGEVTFPGELSNCTGCHLEGTYYPTRDDEDFRLATTFISDNFGDADNPDDVVPTTGRTADRATTLADAEDDLNITANTSACGSCHTSAFAESHMVDEGGSFSAQQTNDGVITFPDPERDRIETCTNCHSPGKDGDVARAHGL